MIVLMPRTYSFTRGRGARALAAGAAAALIAGCGASATPGGSSSAAAGSPPAPSAAATGTAAQAAGPGSQAGSGSSAGTSVAAGTIGKGAAPRFTRQSERVKVVPLTLGSSAPGVVSDSGGESLSVGVPSGRAGGHRAPTRARTHASSGAPGETAPKRSSAPPQTTPRRPTAPAPRRRVGVKTVVRVRTVVRTVTRVLRPDVPSEAFLPSRHPALDLASFTVAGDNISCTLNARSVRCLVVHRLWAPPIEPSSCHGAWGDALTLATKLIARFACGGSTTPPREAKLIPDGWDDRIGEMTCQVRGIGVGCFSASHHGFFLSRTGYALY